MKKVENLLITVAEHGLRHFPFWWIIVGAAWAIGVTTAAIELSN